MKENNEAGSFTFPHVFSLPGVWRQLLQIIDQKWNGVRVVRMARHCSSTSSLVVCEFDFHNGYGNHC